MHALSQSCRCKAGVAAAKQKKQGKLKGGKKRKRDDGDHGEYGVTRGVDFRGVKAVVNVDAPANLPG